MKGAYYNEIEPFAAEWLRRLIVLDLIAPGDVDERSIEDVSPDDLRDYTQCHFFAGIGVWSHALRKAGWVDSRPVWTGSCPCQPFSQAGKGGGFDDERHLWPAWEWLIGQSKPDVVLGEQVASKDGLAWFDLVQADMEGQGYTGGAVDLCAAGVGGPHIRQRLFYLWVQHAKGDGRFERWAESGGRGVEPRCGAGGVRDATDRGLQTGSRIAQGRPALEPERRCEVGRLRDTGLHGCAGRQQPSTDDQGRMEERFVEGPGTEPRGGSCGLSNNNNTGLALGQVEADEPRALRFEGAAFGANEPVRGFWSGADWIWFRDGKYRPVEAGTFPLAPSTPGRVGRLRAYGNAINAEVARVFIEEAMKVMP